MRYAYDERLKKWVVFLDDIVFRLYDTEQECLDYISGGDEE